jgi:hypothetical protein
LASALSDFFYFPLLFNPLPLPHPPPLPPVHVRAGKPPVSPLISLPFFDGLAESGDFEKHCTAIPPSTSPADASSGTVAAGDSCGFMFFGAPLFFHCILTPNYLVSVQK